MYIMLYKYTSENQKASGPSGCRCGCLVIQRVGVNALVMGIFSDNISLKSGKMTCGSGRRRELEDDTGWSKITGELTD